MTHIYYLRDLALAQSNHVGGASAYLYLCTRFLELMYHYLLPTYLLINFIHLCKLSLNCPELKRALKTNPSDGLIMIPILSNLRLINPSPASDGTYRITYVLLHSSSLHHARMHILLA